MTLINSIHTPCKNCTFALYNENTQTGCALKYLDKYKDIIEAYDDSKEFYIINNKKCIGYRENSWFNQFNMEDDSLDTKIAKYHETNKLHYLALVDLHYINLEQLDNICQQITESVSQPQKIIFIRHKDNSIIFTYENIENIIKKYNINYSWRIQTMLDDTISYREILHNAVVINPKYRFICSIEKYTDQIYKVINTINDKIHHQLGSFMIASTPDYSCRIFSGGVYRFGLVNKQDILSDKSTYEII